jgi:hypothetical protein
MRATEEAGTLDQVDDLFHQACAASAYSLHDAVDIRLTWLDIQRRALPALPDTTDAAVRDALPAVVLLRSAVRRVCDYIDELAPAYHAARDKEDMAAWAEFSDAAQKVLPYAADIECRLLYNVGAARAHWDALTKVQSRDPKSWLDFVQFERVHGDLKNARSLFKRAVHLFASAHPLVPSGDGSDPTAVTVAWELQTICTAWVTFERHTGTVATLVEAAKVTDKYLQQQALARVAAATAAIAAPEATGSQGASADSKSRRTGKLKDRQAQRGADMRRSDGGGDAEEPATKKRKTGGRVSFADDSSMTDASAHSNPLPAGPSTAELSKMLNDARTAFVLNLAFNVTDAQIKKLFGQYGTVETVRMKKRPDGTMT